MVGDGRKKYAIYVPEPLRSVGEDGQVITLPYVMRIKFKHLIGSDESAEPLEYDGRNALSGNYTVSAVRQPCACVC
jgi:hypothetical protein